MPVLSEITNHKIVAIIRGANPADVDKIVSAIYKGGVRLVEVTLNSTNALLLIKELNKKWGNDMLIGAGTVLTAQQAKEAIQAGARFIISPSVDIATISITKEENIISIPGAYTATEIVTAHRAGADIIKIFPAGSRVDYFKDLQGPLSHIPMMPTGGITLNNIKDFQKAGAVAFGIGSALVNTQDTIDDKYLAELTNRAKAFTEAVS
ncbi:MAG: bifunctional 4-hydroxy-2-oxoglutarate aldolase/2-dehydro-3-deoxy-phosphogluconate aldolase [Chitinophagaceae bacterium]